MIRELTQHIQTRLVVLNAKLGRHMRESQPSSPANLRIRSETNIPSTEAVIDELSRLLDIMLVLAVSEPPQVILTPVDGGRVLAALGVCIDNVAGTPEAAQMEEVRDKILAQVAMWEPEEATS